MKLFSLFISVILSTCSTTLSAQDTFSIVAADSTTREVGSAGASCVDLFAAGMYVLRVGSSHRVSFVKN